MYTNGGHLYFQTANTYNISFKTDGSGRINFNEMDLTAVMSQVSKTQRAKFLLGFYFAAGNES